ncbi:MAG: hypothetical protein RIR53_1988 [Bacteroidota bacterium]|jgi:hypothetical protein
MSALLFCQALALAQRPVAPVGVDVRGFTEPGYFIAAPLQQDTLVVIDEYARPLLHTRVGLHTNVASYGARYVTHFGGSRRARYFVRRDWNLRPIDTFSVTPPSVADFHEGKVWTDTSMILLGFEEVTMDLSKIVPGGQTNATVLVGVIEEQTFDGTVVFRWRSIDHVALTEATSDIDLTQNYIDYIHINSIWRDADGDLLVSCRHTDQVIRINRQTGDVVWRLGGSAAKRNDFRFLNDTVGGFTGFSHQHTAQRTRRGTLMLFDNGNLKPEPRLSRVVEYEIDESARTVRAIRSIVPDSVGFVQSMGNVEELSGGNIIVGYGNESGRILGHEIDRDGRIVATIRNTTGAPIDPYRVTKARLGMTAVVDTIQGTGRYDFADADSSTGVAISVSRFTADVIAVVERHHTRPPNVICAGRAPDHVLPMRWVLRYATSRPTDALDGSTEIDARVLPRHGVHRVTLYGRDSVGGGPFVRLPASFDSTTHQWTINGVLRGEIIAAIDTLPAAVRLGAGAPVVDASPDAVDVLLSMPAEGVEAEVSLWPTDDPAAISRWTLRQRPDGSAFIMIHQLQPERTYQVSARCVGWSGGRSDSVTWQLRTLRRSAIEPEALEPDVDTLIAADSVRLSWRVPSPFGKILLQRTASLRGPTNGIDLTQVRLDTVDAATSTYTYAPLERGMTYFWRVMYLDSLASGPWSPLMGFATPPPDGQALMPISPVNGSTSADLPVRLAFTTSSEPDDYVVQISELRQNGIVTAPMTLPVVDAGELRVSELNDGSTYFWRVIGTGSDADTGHVAMFRIQRTSSLRDAQPLQIDIAYDGEFVKVRSKAPLRSVALVDLLGRVTLLDIDQGAMEVIRPLPEHGALWQCVVVTDVRGNVIGRPIVRR